VVTEQTEKASEVGRAGSRRRSERVKKSEMRGKAEDRASFPKGKVERKGETIDEG
jgi:hypothetical protein